MKPRAQLQLVKKELSAEELSWLAEDAPKAAFAYPLSVEITSNIDMENTNNPEVTNPEDFYPANILILQKSGGQFDPNQGDMFIRVADVVDMYELPTIATIEAMNSRSSTKSTPFYRTNRFTLFCRSIEEVNTVWTILKQEAKAFSSSYNTAHNEDLTNSETIII